MTPQILTVGESGDLTLTPMSTLTAPVTEATDAITAEINAVTKLVGERHTASVNHANSVKDAVEKSFASVEADLRKDIGQNKKRIFDRTAQCCFSENNNFTGRRMCLPPGAWDIHHMGFNDKISWITCKPGVRAELYSDFFSGRKLDITSGQTFDQNQLRHRGLHDNASTLSILPNS